METKKVKLKDGIECTIKEMSIDDIDLCTDTPEIGFNDDNQPTVIKHLAKARTSWLRAGVVDCTDTFLRKLSDTQKGELLLMVQEFQRLGEVKPSS